MFTRDVNIADIDSRLTARFGAIDHKSREFDFIFTDYYAAEMGGDLKKRFYSFEKLILPGRLSDLKHATIEIEREFSVGGNRTVNLDPGYLEESKLVLASTKNFSHRIYLRDDIWAEVTMRFARGKFLKHEWTYPDWSQDLAIDFLTKVRSDYKNQLDSMMA